MPTEDLDYLAAIEYLYSRIDYERTADSRPYPFRLRRMRELLDRLELRCVAGDEIPVVHIAGTKGKGSTATMVAAMLTAGGVRTGLYTSPHLIDLAERFVVDGELATRGEVIDLVNSVRRVADRLADSESGPPTFFELTTAIALLHFRRQGCQAVVLEVGLGGRLDSTNVCRPAVTAITSIGLDHQHILGNSLAEIASQKAGIIKPAVPVVSGVSEGPAAAVIESISRKQRAPIYRLGRDFDFHIRPSGRDVNDESDCDTAADRQPQWSSRLDICGRDDLPLNTGEPSVAIDRVAVTPRHDWRLPLGGNHQGRNAAVACMILDLLNAATTDPRVTAESPPRLATAIGLDSQARGLAAVRCAGRIERFLAADQTEVILDTAHNVDSIAALCETLRERAAGRTVTVIFGTSRDKDHRPMLEQLVGVANRLILTRYHGNPRYRPPADMLLDLPAGFISQTEESPATALTIARQAAQPPGEHLIVVCGSFFLAAEVRPLLT